MSILKATLLCWQILQKNNLICNNLFFGDCVEVINSPLVKSKRRQLVTAAAKEDLILHLYYLWQISLVYL